LSTPTQVKMSTTEIDSEIIVFDGEGVKCHLQYVH
jgi:outer membrane lipoprotein-sorting protein